MLTNKLSETELDVIANALTYEITSYDKEKQNNNTILTDKIKELLSSSSESENILLFSSYIKTMLNNYTIHLLNDIKATNSESEQNNIRTSLYCCSYLASEI